MTAGTAEDRAVGALLGLAAGDATGTTLEFKPPRSFEPITDMVGGGPFRLPAGAWTDDTSMALALAESLLDTGGMDLTDQMRRYVMWWQEGYLSSIGECFDIGNATSSQLLRFHRTGVAVDPVVHESMQANGSLMRLAGVPIRWFADTAEAARQSGESSRPTHNAPAPVDACRVMGAMVAALVQGAEWAEVTDPGFWSWGPLDPAIDAVVCGSFRTTPDKGIRGSGHCVRAVEAALWAVDGAGGFRDAVLRAANLGDDADTTAAIAGQLAGARWGASGIPSSWVAKLVLSHRIVELARQLFHAGGGTLDHPAGWPHDDWFHAYWVEPGRVLAGEYAGADRSPKDRDKVNLLVDAGVRTVIDLTAPADGVAPYAPLLEEAARRRRLDLVRVAFPIPDMGVAEMAVYDEIVRVIRSASPGVVYVHCWGGMGRTGTVAGCLLVDDGLSYEQTIDRLADLRAGTRKSHHRVPQADVQDDLLRRRAAGR
ncbi:MAG: ADP-ribosylglycohydrolase family protein [Actinomycetota bacterium]|nr:ADP-ribosylglycohydrolase family protein [Actinomycetota bacterium]